MLAIQAAEGLTVLLSSHILAEVQQVCDSATIIGHGRMLASGLVEELIGTSTTYRVGVEDLERGARVLTDAGHAVRAESRSLVVDTQSSPTEITRALADAGLYLSELVPLRADLESVFLELTEGSTLGHGVDVGLVDPGLDAELPATEVTR